MVNKMIKKWFLSHEVNPNTDNDIVCGFVNFEEQTASIPTNEPNEFIGIDLKFRLNNSDPSIKPLHLFDSENEALEFYARQIGS